MCVWLLISHPTKYLSNCSSYVAMIFQKTFMIELGKGFFNLYSILTIRAQMFAGQVS